MKVRIFTPKVAVVKKQDKYSKMENLTYTELIDQNNVTTTTRTDSASV